VSDPLPAGTSFVSASDSGVYSAGTNTVSWSLGAFTESNGRKPVRTVVKWTSSLTTDPSNTATVSSSTPDATPGNNSAIEATVVNTCANLSITTSDSPDPVTSVIYLTYTIPCHTLCPSATLFRSVSDPLPAGTSFVSASDSGVYSAGTNTVSWSLGAFTE